MAEGYSEALDQGDELELSNDIEYIHHRCSIRVTLIVIKLCLQSIEQCDNGMSLSVQYDSFDSNGFYRLCFG